MVSLPTKSRFASTFVNRGYEALPYQLDVEGYESLRELLAYYNQVGGPVRQVHTQLAPPARLHSNVANTAVADLDRLLRGLTGIASLDSGANDALAAGGKGFALSDMFLTSIGEGIERVVGALARFVDSNDRVTGTYRELTAGGTPCLAPENCPLFSDDQYGISDFAYDRFTEDSVLSWVEARRLISGERVYVPAQLVELFHLADDDEAQIGYAQSGGLSCHISRERAICHAATEIVERDQVNLRWYLRIPPEEVIFDREPRDSRLRLLLDDLQARPAKVRVLYHSLDIPEVPVLTAIELSTWWNEFSWCCGLGAALDVEGALLSALSEFGQSDGMLGPTLISPGRAMPVMVRRAFDVAPDAPLETMTNYIQAIGYYGHRASREKLRWYLEENATIGFAALADAAPPPTSGADRVKEIFSQRGIDPIVVDFTPAGNAQLALVKVFIPELTQAFLPSRPMFGHPRFSAIAEKYADRVGCRTPQAEPPLPYP